VNPVIVQVAPVPAAAHAGTVAVTVPVPICRATVYVATFAGLSAVLNSNWGVTV
jgi:hypothetical protein